MIQSQTPLGTQLRALRELIVKSGCPLLDWDELTLEVRGIAELRELVEEADKDQVEMIAE